MNYKNLEVWQIARELSIEIHKMTFLYLNLNCMKKGARLGEHQNLLDQIL